MYDAEIRNMDRHLGDLLGALDETGTADDTLVIILGDHGEMMGENDVFFDHHSLYEGNIKPPLLARWPSGGVTGGRVVDVLTQHVDLAPTMLSAAGLAIPETIEGSDILPHLRGESDLPVHDALYTCECSWQAGWAIRTDTHKLLLARGPGLHNQPPRELYDFRVDPLETTNVALSQWEIAAELEDRLEGWIGRKLRQNGLDADPVCHDNITLGLRAWEFEAERQAERRRS